MDGRVKPGHDSWGSGKGLPHISPLPTTRCIEAPALMSKPRCVNGIYTPASSARPCLRNFNRLTVWHTGCLKFQEQDLRGFRDKSIYRSCVYAWTDFRGRPRDGRSDPDQL